MRPASIAALLVLLACGTAGCAQYHNRNYDGYSYGRDSYRQDGYEPYRPTYGDTSTPSGAYDSRYPSNQYAYGPDANGRDGYHDSDRYGSDQDDAYRSSQNGYRPDADGGKGYGPRADRYDADRGNDARYGAQSYDQYRTQNEARDYRSGSAGENDSYRDESSSHRYSETADREDVRDHRTRLHRKHHADSHHTIHHAASYRRPSHLRCKKHDGHRDCTVRSRAK